MIQIDMFEVGLGAGLLMQFETDDGSVRVLADAGVQHGRDPAECWPRVASALRGFGDGPARIDLMIGTHYDADHLEGLVPIIEDESIVIGEAWLPPVADDTQAGVLGMAPSDDQLLALKFIAPGNDALLAYLREKARRLDALARFREHISGGELHQVETFSWKSGETFDIADDSLLQVGDGGFFEARLADASIRAGRAGGHDDEQIHGPPATSIRELNLKYYDARFLPGWIDPQIEMNAAGRSLAWVEASEAADAINAKSLKKVVAALKARSKPVDIACRTVDDGQPRRFAWNAATKRFMPGIAQPSDGPELTLLAPSKGLVAKYSRRLPIGDYGSLLAFARIPVVGTTASNELSYVMKLSHNGQNILVAGDAGCVDFKPNRRKKAFYPDLIAELASLDVVQVAHHAGANTYFYHSLVEAKYPEQEKLSYLLISHGVDDAKRPSLAFANFIERFRADTQKVSLLFTSRPQRAKVRDFADLMEPLRGGSTPLDRGDVQLIHDDQGWRVTQHHIQV
jgi:hypothetical protein